MDFTYLTIYIAFMACVLILADRVSKLNMKMSEFENEYNDSKMLEKKALIAFADEYNKIMDKIESFESKTKDLENLEEKLVAKISEKHCKSLKYFSEHNIRINELEPKITQSPDYHIVEYDFGSCKKYAIEKKDRLKPLIIDKDQQALVGLLKDIGYTKASIDIESSREKRERLKEDEFDDHVIKKAKAYFKKDGEKDYQFLGNCNPMEQWNRINKWMQFSERVIAESATQNTIDAVKPVDLESDPPIISIDSALSIEACEKISTIAKEVFGDTEIRFD